MNFHCIQWCLCKLFSVTFSFTPGLKSEDPVGREAFKVAIWKTYWRYRVTGTEEQVCKNIFLSYLSVSTSKIQGTSSLFCQYSVASRNCWHPYMTVQIKNLFCLGHKSLSSRWYIYIFLKMIYLLTIYMFYMCTTYCVLQPNFQVVNYWQQLYLK